jgi:hypothetical protein
MCVAALKDDASRFIDLMRGLGQRPKQPSKKDLRQWPVFKAMRKRQDVQEAFEMMFGEPMNVVPTKDGDGAKAEPRNPTDPGVH